MKWLKCFENFTKGKWELILANKDKVIEGQRLIDLVRTAYAKTHYKSFINTVNDVLKSHWYVIDFKNEEDIDACLFYRTPRADENWVGKKIQGIVHDGTKESKKIAIKKLIELLNNEGVWIEASDKLEDILIKNSNIVDDVSIIKKLFPDSKITMFKSGQYQRSLVDGRNITERVFGFPKFREY